jgi:membrane-bound inhibitor of C-type lysozyme
MIIVKLATPVAMLGILAGCGQPDDLEPVQAPEDRPVLRQEISPPEQAATGTPFQCGDRSVVFETFREHGRMVVNGESFDMTPAVSASGARYTAIDGSDTEFWNKGDQATVTVRGEALPECQAVLEPQWPLIEGRLLLHRGAQLPILAHRAN